MRHAVREGGASRSIYKSKRVKVIVEVIVKVIGRAGATRRTGAAGRRRAAWAGEAAACIVSYL